MSGTDGWTLQLGHQLKIEYDVLFRQLMPGLRIDAFTGGKFIRSSAAYSLIGNVPNARLLALCTSLEMLHTSTLVHDDIIDEADVRRGQPSVSRAVGDDAALLVGNLVAGRALQLVKDETAEIRGEFIEAMLNVNRGQLMELSGRYNPAKSIQSYFDTISGKTSAMMRLAAVCGSACAKYPIEIQDLICDAIEELSIGFQITDDIEDHLSWLLQRSLHPTKSAAYDIELGNFTLPTLIAIKQNGEAAAQLTRYPKQPHEVCIPALWREAFEETIEMAARHLSKAADLLIILREEARFHPPLRAFADWGASVIRGLGTPGLSATISCLADEGGRK